MSSTARTVKTVSALVVILSLLVSLLAIASPVLADHDPADGPAVAPTQEDFPGGGPKCPDGTKGVRFDPPTSGSKEVAFDGPDVTVTITTTETHLTFVIEGGLAAKVFVKGGNMGQNVYDYTGLPGGGIAHDDGLIVPTGQGLSHIDFCVFPVPGSIIVHKTDQLGNDVEGATFELYRHDELVQGPADTDANGIVCFDGLYIGREYKVVETAAPDGWLKADPDWQTADAVEGTCEDRAGGDPDLTFENTRVGSLIVLKTDDSAQPVALAGAEFTVGETTQTTGDNGMTCFDDLIAGDLYDVTETTPPPGYDPADPDTQNVAAGEGSCDERSEASADVTFTNSLTEEERGSITIVKCIEDGDEPALDRNSTQSGDELPIACENSETLDGVTFDIYLEADYPGGPILDTQTTAGGGLAVFEDLALDETYVIVESGLPEGLTCEIADVHAIKGIEWTLNDDGSVTVALSSNEADIALILDNECEEDEGGVLELIKFFCPTAGEDAMFVFGPLLPEPVELGVLGGDELPSDEGCTLGAPSEEALGATFTITGGDLVEPLVVHSTWDEILTLELAAGTYEIVEEGTGLMAEFEVAEGGDTAVVVFNYLDDQGLLKILKFYCDGEGDVAFTIAEGDVTIGDVDLPDNCDNPTPGDADFTLNDGEMDSAVFDLGDDGARLIPLNVGTYTLSEVDPNEATSAEFNIVADLTTTAIVFNFTGEDEEPGNPGGGGEGTQGGNPIPDTAADLGLTGSVPAAILALLMLSGLGAAGYVARAEARRRR